MSVRYWLCLGSLGSVLNYKKGKNGLVNARLFFCVVIVALINLKESNVFRLNTKLLSDSGCIRKVVRRLE